MMKIGELSLLSKVTIKTIRYYEEEGLLSPSFVDKDSNYRYYDYSKLIKLNEIVRLRNIGISIKDIKKINAGNNINDILIDRTNAIKNEISSLNEQLSQINIMMEEIKLNQVFIKELPECIVYQRVGTIKKYDDLASFVFETANKVLSLNPSMKCNPIDYCYVEYLDNEYKEENINIRYSEAVLDIGVGDNEISFTKIKAVNAICIKHMGSYSKLRDSYKIIMDYINKNNLVIIDKPRECYIDGCWNKESIDEYLTEIQIPVSIK